MKSISRRQLLRGSAAGLGVIAVGSRWLAAQEEEAPGDFAEKLVQTPRQTEGPFYPNRLPLDTDNDLLIVNDAITPAVGEVTHLSGRFLTGSTGEYYFRTIKPVPYPGRTPHIHFAVKTKAREPFTTQCYVKGEPQNARDRIYNSVRDPRAKAAITVDFAPLPKSSIGELAARFDIVLGVTPKS